MDDADFRLPASYEIKVFTPKDRYVKVYRFLAFQTFNTIIFILILNLTLAGLFLVRDHYLEKKTYVDARVSSYREKFADLQAYTRISSAQANKYLDNQDAMGSIGFHYKPWVQFQNPPFHGALLNTNEGGFRRTTEPRPYNGKPIKIYVFGGSTTFGYGVPDEHTIPSYMQKILEREYPDRDFLVRNYGQGFYYSSQEMLLLISLIKDGDIPDWAVFIDGANDTGQLHREHDQPWFTSKVRTLWDAKRGASSPKTRRDFLWIPMVRFAYGLSRRLLPSKTENTAEDSHKDKGQGSKTVLGGEDKLRRVVDYVIQRYTSNVRIIRAICREYGIKCRFVWQPIPFYKYDRSLHRTFPYEGPIEGHWGGVYSRMKSYTEEDFLYLGEMLRGVSEKVFVDDVHYNERYNEKIAARICSRLQFDRSNSHRHRAD